MLTYTLYGPPRTKKNSQRVFRLPSGGTRIAPSAAYVQYEWDCLRQLPPPSRPLAGPVNVKCLYFMPTRRRVDLTNLLEATDDILVRAGVLADDCATIVAAHDGSRVLLDRKRPRVEITITEMEEADNDEARRQRPAGEGGGPRRNHARAGGASRAAL